MAYDTLVKEAKDLPEDMIEQIIELWGFWNHPKKSRQNAL